MDTPMKSYNCANPIEPLICLQCAGFETHELIQLEYHLKAGHTFLEFEEKLHTCRRCNFQTYSKFLSSRHKLLNLCVRDGEVKPEAAISEEETAKFEIREKTGTHPLTLKWFKCNECDYQTLGSSLLEIHMNLRHPRGGEFACKKCTYRARDPSDLKRHSRSQHFSKSPQTKPTLSDHTVRFRHSGCFECDHCSYTTLFESVLSDHTKTMHNPFKCERCPYTAKTINKLKTHTLIKHTPADEVPWFECEHCAYKTTTKINLHNHTDHKHGSRRWLKCDSCQFETKFGQTLKKHTLSKHTHPENVHWFECAQCPYRSVEKAAVKKHVNYKHGKGTRLKCDQCAFETKHSHSLKSHVFSRHVNPKTSGLVV